MLNIIKRKRNKTHMRQFCPFSTNQVSVGATATLIVAANASRSGLQITNIGNSDVYIGESNVTPSTGHLLPTGKGNTVSFSNTTAVYGVTAGGSETVSFLETK
jgi:hypothetical protein